MTISSRRIVNLLAKRSSGLLKQLNEMEQQPKKRTDPMAQKEADALGARILASLADSTLDVNKITTDCTNAIDLADSDPGLSVESRVANAALQGDWKLSWVSSDDAISEVGSGLHRVPLAKLEDIFVSIRASSSKGGALGVETAEIIRIMGPFPNVRNTLAGSARAKGSSLMVSYDKMIDGNGGVIKAPGGESTRQVTFRAFVAAGCLVLRPGGPGVFLIFTREPDLDAALKRLRVDRPADWDTQAPKNPFKLPWQK